MTLDLKEMACAIEKVIDETGWHQDGECTPTMFMVYTEADGRLKPRKIPAPEMLWEMSPTVGIGLRIMAAALTKDENRMLREVTRRLNPVAVFVSTEAWQVKSTPENIEKDRELAKERGLHLHPDRVEVRILLGQVIGSDEKVLIQRERGTGEVDITDGIDGEVPDGLAALAAAFKFAIDEGGNPVTEAMKNAIERLLTEDG